MISRSKEFLSIKQVSKTLSIPLRTVYRLIKQGSIKSIRIGGRIRCFKDDIEKYYHFGTNYPKVPSGETIERRAYPRINSNLYCQYSINLPPFKAVVDSGIIKNISIGGVFLILDNENFNDIDIDDPINLEFNIEDKEKSEIKIKGKIVRKTTKGLGIKFRKLSDKNKNLIGNYIG